MSFDWGNFLTLAKYLSHTGRTNAEPPAAEEEEEAKLRTSISRSYYSAHHLAKKHLHDVDGDVNIPRGGPAHMYVISA